MLNPVRPYIQIARIDHWFKNAFMLLGIVLAFFFRPELLGMKAYGSIVLGLFATCIVASSNYVLNELLDAPLDREHPTKRFRPAACGLIKPWIAILEWLGLGALGIGLAFVINTPFGLAATALWVMGVAYNVPPIRTKELPYIDVLSESVNNPIRLLLGWFALVPMLWPPISLMVSYWMAGAFFMASKRYAEYRAIGDPTKAASYRRSFAHYNEPRLLTSMIYYMAACALCAGVFMVRYRPELVLLIPVVAAFFGSYFKLSLAEDSPVQAPENLWRHKGFMFWTAVTTLGFIGLMFVEIKGLDAYLGLPEDIPETLWKIPR